PDLERLALLVEAGDATLIHHADPEIAVIVGLEIERSDRKARLDHGNRIFGNLPGLGIELAQELLAEMAEPDHAVGIDHCIVRLDLLTRQIVLSDDHARGTPGRARQPLELVGPDFLFAQIDRSKVLGERLDAVEVAEISPRAADQSLRMLRRAARIIAGH